MSESFPLPKVPRNASDEHDFHVLGARRFEHFARALHEAQPDIYGSQLYGPDGQTQFGVDHIAFRLGASAPELEVGQSKAYRRFGPADLRKAAKDFTDHWDMHWQPQNVRRFILFVGCAIKSREATDEIIRLTQAFAQLGVIFEVWNANTIYDRLPAAPAVVRTHLGQDWYSSLFGEPVGPLTGLMGDLQRGDHSAFVVGGYVARLNQAESAELAELRRRARRGETAAVIAALEAMLAYPVAGATAPEVQAGQKRMLGGLLIRRDAGRARRLLDEADALDGSSERQRHILLLETIGPDAALAAIDATGNAEFAEIRAIAHLRLGAPASAVDDLAPFTETEDANAETLRIAALAKLAAGERAAALGYAERAVQRDPEARAGCQALAICHFHAALSDAAVLSLGEWPQPVDQPLIRTSDDARHHLDAAERLFGELAADSALDDHGSARMWQLGTLACMPWRRDDLVAQIAGFEADDALPIPMVGWCVTRGLPFDADKAAARCDAQLAADPQDFETLLIRIALANSRRDYDHARRLLDGGRDALVAAGHASVHGYWSALLDVEQHRPGKNATSSEHPWLRFRLALNIRHKKARLKAIGALLEAELEGGQDPRVILAAAQVLLDGGWHKTAVKTADFLLERIATGEAIAVATHALYRNHRWHDVLAALEQADAFPSGRLPADLERLRAECQAGSGDLVAARTTSVILAQTTGQPRDIWRSIEFHLATGAEPAALAMYEEHADKLGTPTNSHVLLANAVATSNPDAAARITRQIAAAAPDALVSATFALANRLRLDAEQHTLVSRMSRLGAKGDAGVRILHVDQLVDWINERNAQIEEIFEKYANGHLPVHLLAGARSAALPLAYLQPLLEPPSPDQRTSILSTRYGRRYDDAAWPAAREDVTLLADVTALLTAHGLDLLDAVERAFAPIMIAPDTINALLAMRSDVELPQPSRMAAARDALARLADGEIAVAEEPQIDAFTVMWEGLGEPAATLNLPRLLDTALADLPEAARAPIRDQLGTILDPSPAGATPPPGSLVNLDAQMLVTLGEAGALAPIRKLYRIATTAEDKTRLQGEVTNADVRERLAASLAQLSKRLATGLDDGTYRAVPVIEAAERNPVQRSFMQLLDAMRGSRAIFWVDDRFTSAVDNATFRVVTTVEVMAALRRYGRLPLERERALRQKLRAARWAFMPLDGDELAALLRPAVRDGAVRETEDLAVLRRAMGDLLRNRRRLQWPDPATAGTEVRGEVPFLLDCGHAIAHALAAIWNDATWSVADAEAASRWIVDQLETGLFPLPILAAGDPRSDHMIGTHLGGLVLVALQIRPGKIDDPRKGQFLTWLVNEVVRPNLRVRPEFRSAMDTMIEGFLVSDDDEEDKDAKTVALWRTLAGMALNTMPDDIRLPLMERERIRREFGLAEHGMMGVEPYDFDEMAFWTAMANASTTGDQPLDAMTGETGTVTLTDDADGRALLIAIGGATLRLDAWPWEIASDDPAIRDAALAARADALDLSEADAVALGATLAALPAAERGRYVLRREHDGMARWYRDLEEKLAKRIPFQVTDLEPPAMLRVPRLYRFAGDVEQAATALIAERGLAVALRRLGGLPITPPKAIEAAIGALAPALLTVLLDEAQIDTAPPWTQLWVAGLLLTRADRGARVRDRTHRWQRSALSPETDLYWQLYTALARFTAREGCTIAGWTSLTAAEQLLVAWGHANSIAEIVIVGNVRLEPLIALLRQNRFVSPRLLIEPQSHFHQDRADPMHISTTRLKAHAALPALVALARDDTTRDAAVAAIRHLLYDDGRDKVRLRVEIAEGGLRHVEALDSLFGADWSAELEEIEPGWGGLFGSALTALATAVLALEKDAAREGSAWPFLTMITGDASFPAALADTARDSATTAFAPEAAHGPHRDPQVLLAFARLAGGNGWIEHGAAIEDAILALDTDALATEDDNRALLLELAMARAMLEPDPLDRTRVLGRHLARLGHNAQLRPQVESATRQLARGLSGQFAEAFVDALGELFAES